MNASAAATQRRRLTFPRLDAWGWLMLGVVVCASVVIVLMPGILFWLSFREGHPIDPVSNYSLLHYVQVLNDKFVPEVLLNTVVCSRR
jgi:ABC-type spermidine/putrescine transport system permease subunit II